MKLETNLLETDPWAKHRTLASDAGLVSAVIDARRYTSPEIYEAERDKIFRRTWLLVARASEIPNPGDFIKRAIHPLEAEALIVRGKDSVIRAFHNSCPHRGAALTKESEGTARLFVCPYHAWSFGSDGTCKAIPGAEFFPHLDKDEISLTPIHADIWNGFIFLNFDNAPRQTLAEYLSAFGERYADVPFHEFTHAVEMTLDVETNWKCLLDAFVESYHVPVLHKKSVPMVPTKANPLSACYDPRFWPPHHSFILQTNPEWIPTGNVLNFVYAAAGAAMLHSDSIPSAAPRWTTLADCKSINPIDLPNYGLTMLTIFPFTQIYVFPDRYMVQHFWPLGVDKTRLIVRAYFRSPPTNHLEEFATAHLLASTRDVLSEDAAVTGAQQRSLKSGGVKQLHLGENELLIRYTCEVIETYLSHQGPS